MNLPNLSNLSKAAIVVPYMPLMEKGPKQAGKPCQGQSQSQEGPALSATNTAIPLPDVWY